MSDKSKFRVIGLSFGYINPLQNYPSGKNGSVKLGNSRGRGEHKTRISNFDMLLHDKF